MARKAQRPTQGGRRPVRGAVPAAGAASGSAPASTRGSTSETIDYKDLNLMRRFISDRGKVRSRRVTGLSRQHQRELALAVKRARELAMLPYVGER